MKKILSCAISLLLLLQQASFAAVTPVSLLEQNPWLLANKISYNLDRVELLLKSTGTEAVPAITSSGAKEIQLLEENIITTLRKKANDANFIKDVLEYLHYNDAVSVNSKFSKQYTKEVLKAIQNGGAPVTSEKFLLKLPNFLKESAMEMLTKGSLDFEHLVRLIQTKLSVQRERAVALALAAEIEFSKEVVGGTMSSLRNQINTYKYIRRHNQASRVSVNFAESVPAKISKSSKELLELKRIYPDTEKAMLYALGQERVDEITKIVKGTKDIEHYLRGINTRGSLEAVVKRMKASAPVLALVGVFTLVFVTSASANNDVYKQVVSQAVSARVETTREINKVLKEHPEVIGLVYSGNDMVKSIVEESINTGKQGAPDIQNLFGYIQDWSEDMRILTTDKNAFNEYAQSLKQANDQAAAQEREQIIKGLTKDLTARPDNTTVKQVIIPAELMQK